MKRCPKMQNYNMRDNSQVHLTGVVLGDELSIISRVPEA